jgi:hypothetical protein
MNYKTILIILFFTFQPPAFGQAKVLRKNISGSKDLPLEVNLLLESLQKDPSDYFGRLLPVVTNIDLYARSLSKEDIFMIGKVEVYKTLLKNYDTPIRLPVDGTSVKTLQTAIAKTQDNFIKWFLQALLQDALSLVNNPTYKEFLLQKNANEKTDKVEYKKLEKKASLLQFWISKISIGDEDFTTSFRSELAPRMLEALKNIDNSFHLMATLGSGVPLTDVKGSDLKLFSIKEAVFNPPVAPKAKEKTVEDILAPIAETPAVPQLPASPSTAPIMDLPKPVDENWLEDENAPAKLKNLPNPSNDADWLQDF